MVPSGTLGLPKQISAMGQSLIVFQHVARMKRDLHIEILQRRFQAECGVGWVGVLSTSNVAYFVVPARAHEAELRAACAEVGRRWYPWERMA
jgi:hypothetical protein